MSRIPAVHYALRDVNSRPGKIEAFVYVAYSIDWSAMHAHAHSDVVSFLQRLTDIQSALHRRLRSGEEQQHHSIACR